jgi:hypothetical protein
MKRVTLIMFSVLLLHGLTVQAQKKAKISFTSKEYDYGLIKEADGKKTCTFEFSNTGTDTLKILSIKSVSLCVTSNLSRIDVAPGGKKSFEVTFDPKNRIGPFQKSVEVTTNDSSQSKITLLIKGEVEARVKRAEEIYPHQMGHLYGKPSQLTFKNMFNYEVKTDTLKLYNGWDKEMILGFTTLPSHIKCKAVPAKLAPHEKGYVLITYDAAVKNDYGYVYDMIIIETNDSIEPGKKVGMSANILEDFSKLTQEQKANAPKVKFDSLNFDFGTIKEGEKAEHNFIITNEGKSELMIRKAKASCGCTTSTPEKTNLKPGESTNIHVVFNSRGMKEKQQKNVTVYCNDPVNPVTVLNITGTVVK